MHIQALEIESPTVMVSMYFSTAKVKVDLLHSLSSISYAYKILARVLKECLANLTKLLSCLRYR
jgi:hypothetical protein